MNNQITKLKATISKAKGPNRRRFEVGAQMVAGELLDRCLRENIELKLKVDAAHDRIDELTEATEQMLTLLEQANKTIEASREAFASLRDEIKVKQ